MDEFVINVKNTQKNYTTKESKKVCVHAVQTLRRTVLKPVRTVEKNI